MYVSMSRLVSYPMELQLTCLSKNFGRNEVISEIISSDVFYKKLDVYKISLRLLQKFRMKRSIGLWKRQSCQCNNQRCNV